MCDRGLSLQFRDVCATLKPIYIQVFVCFRYKLNSDGSFVGYETDENAWELVCERNVRCGSSEFGNANTGQCSVTIPAHTRQSLYLHGARDLLSAYGLDQNLVGTVFTSDDNLDAYYGAPVDGLFGSIPSNYPVIPKISVNYDVADAYTLDKFFWYGFDGTWYGTYPEYTKQAYGATWYIFWHTGNCTFCNARC